MSDASIGQWQVQAKQLARCLTATNPEFMDQGYSEIAARFLDGKAPPVAEARPEGTWLQVGLGYAFIGPTGGPHFYTRVRPEGVADADIVPVTVESPGRLLATARTVSAQARRFAAGEPVNAAVDGKPVSFTCPAADREDVARTGALLEGALAAIEPEYNRRVLREHAGLPMSEMLAGRTVASAVQASRAAVAGLRANYAADGWLVAVTLTRALLAEYLPPDAPGATRLLFKFMEGLSCGHDPERMLHQVVRDTIAAGHAPLVVRVADTEIAQARACKDAALAATTVDGHADGLYEAAQHGFTAWLLSDLMRRAIPPSDWPPRMTAAKWSGYLATAEETVVRASVALEVGCINAATHAPLKTHIAEVRAKGPAWADELIGEYWYYPTCARPRLLGG